MSEKVDTYQLVTDRIVAALEEGTVPWERPWRTIAGYGPTSLSTGQPYHGINTLILGLESMAKGYSSQYWTTFKQAKERGGTVRKGEKSTPIVFWRIVEKKDSQGETESKFGLLRHFAVFNSEQCDGVEIPSADPVPVFDPIDRAESVQATMKQRPEVKHSPEDRAYYSPLLDYVHMPIREAFTSAEGYYATLFHELIHATGHESRIGRKGIEAVSSFGSEVYAKEELVAEIGSAFVCGEVGIAPRIPQHASYVASWIKALKNDSRLIVGAASQAAKASDWILGY